MTAATMIPMASLVFFLNHDSSLAGGGGEDFGPGGEGPGGLGEGPAPQAVVMLPVPVPQVPAAEAVQAGLLLPPPPPPLLRSRRLLPLFRASWLVLQSLGALENRMSSWMPQPDRKEMHGSTKLACRYGMRVDTTARIPDVVQSCLNLTLTLTLIVPQGSQT